MDPDAASAAGADFDAVTVPLLQAALVGTTELPPRRFSLADFPTGFERLVPDGLLQTLRPAAVLIAILRRPEGATVLLTKRSEQLRAHQGQVSFPGGRRDDGDDTLAWTALREANEEVGLPPDAVRVLGYLDDYPTLTRYRVTPVVGVVEVPPPVWRPEPGEVAEVFELPLARVLQLSTYRQRSLLREGIRLPFYELEHGPHRIWGATAGMLRQLALTVNGGV